MRVALAISSFQQNDAVCALLDIACTELADVFSDVFVVESMGDGGVAAHVKAKGYAVTVKNISENIGSAGNLALRMQIAAEAGADWLYAVNHDGELSLDTLHHFMDAARQNPRAGALYPCRLVPARNRYDVTGGRKLPLPFMGIKDASELATFTPVRWGSSNGAFYNLRPVREGLLPRAELWMGWEDLDYGWALEANGWKQYVVRDALFIDDREYLHRSFFGRKFTISDKPAWYNYYFARNFMLIAKEDERTVAERATIVARIGLEAVLATAFKPTPLKRLRYIGAGVRDGLAGRSGKWQYP